MMRRKIRRGISILLSLGMVCSVPVCTGGITTDAAAVGENTSGEVSVKKTAASTGGSSYGDVHADESTGYLYKLYDDGTDDVGQKIEIVGYLDTGIAPMAETDEDTGTDLVIPGTLDGNEVASIGDNAFKGNQTITSVTISEGITSIGYSAFENCTKVARVSIPSTITKWVEVTYDNNAFKGCTGLKELELEEGLTILGQAAFYGCTSLEQVKIPSTIETFNNSVFYDCTSLKEVELPEGIKQIGYRAFGNCALEEVTIPSTVESWQTVRANGITAPPHNCSAFSGCASLRKIVFTEGLKTLNNFQGIDSSCPLIKEIEIPGSVEDLSYAFEGAQHLEKVTLNEGTERIGYNAFRRCTALKEISFPSTILSKETSSFEGAGAVERVIFSSLGMPEAEDMTASFDNLKEIYILSTSVGTYEEFNLSADTKLYCPQDSKTYQTYQSALADSGQGDKLVAIPSAGVEATAYQAVYDGEEHDAVTVSGIQEGDKVRYRINAEKQLREEMPKVKEPGKYLVFVYVERPGEGEELLSAYSALSLQAEVQQTATSTPSPSPTPGGNATPTPGGQATPTPKPTVQPLKVGSAVTAGKFKYKVTNATAGKLAVAVSAPKSKTAKSAVIPATVKVQGSTYQVTSIAANAFKNCKKLKSITIGKNVTSIGKNAFANAKALKKITVKTTKLKSVGKGAFKGIHKKAAIKVPKAKLKKYKKLFKGKGQKKTVKIKK